MPREYTLTYDQSRDMMDDDALAEEPPAMDSLDGEDAADSDATPTFEAGDCPFCEDYDGEYPRRHASKAHPEQYEAINDA